MADKRIQDLTPASSVQTSDRFVLEQDGQAKSLTGQVLMDDLATALDGHGGISNISYTAPSSGSVDGTLTITLADGTVSTFTITNGVGIDSIADKWAVSSSNSTAPSTWYDDPQTMTATDRYEWHYQIITLSDGSSINTDEAVVGVYGDTGDADHVYIKWAATEPTSDSDMSSAPDAWIGIATTTAESAPSHYTDYSWYEYKGATGDTGNGIVSITLESSSGVVDTYKVLFDDGTHTTFSVTNGSNINSITKTSTSGLIDTYTVSLTNGDTTSFNVINAKSITSITNVDVTHVAGHTDVYRINYNDGDTFTFSIYNGTNGSGSVSTVDGVAADGTQNVPLLLLGSGAPTTSTVGILKQRYFDQTNSVLYICTGIDSSGGESTYTWQGAGVTVDNSLSLSSTNPVQNAVLTSIIGLDSLDTTAQTLTGAVNELKLAMSGYAENIADEYDPTATYAVNDLCIHDNTLYRCNTAITTAEAWNSIHWTQTTVADNKVSKTGDTMTGNLVLDGTFIERKTNISSTTPSETEYADFFIVNDENQERVSALSAVHTSSGQKGTILQAARRVNGLDQYNSLNLRIDASGNKVVAVSDGTAWCDGIGAVNKSGDTMTGDLVISKSTPIINLKNSDANVSLDTDTATRSWYLRQQDKNGNNISMWQSSFSTGGTATTYIATRRIVNNANVDNGISFGVDRAGGRTVSISAPSAWREALGIGTSGALPITIAQGGTGQTDKTTITTISSVLQNTISSITVRSVTYCYWGKVATIDIGFTATAAIASGTQITTILSGKRPIGTLYLVDSLGGHVRINISGAITVHHAITSGYQFSIGGTYIIA